MEREREREREIETERRRGRERRALSPERERERVEGERKKIFLSAGLNHKTFHGCNYYCSIVIQGTLTEWDGSVQLTSFY
jgi:hypothetical protein